MTLAVGEHTREWRPPFSLDIGSVLGQLRRGPGDPAYRVDRTTGVTWLAANTPSGAGTLAVQRKADGTVVASAWGPAADHLLDGLPAMLGADDDPYSFVAYHPIVQQSYNRMIELRLGSTGRVWDVLVAAVLEQKVTGTEAHRSWRELALRYGKPAPGPVPAGMRVPPEPKALLAIPDWEWHRAGVDGARRRTLIAAAQVAHRLENAVSLRGNPGRDFLRKVPGIGVWTAAEVAQRAWGDPDAVSVGDFHLAKIVGTVLVGRRVDDAGMLELLAPYAPQRQRAVRYVLMSGVPVPRFGPRFSPRDYRRM
jgi:3-methyladenine DNA glycosylase/8-oxoguanine DNA glycosylase